MKKKKLKRLDNKYKTFKCITDEFAEIFYDNCDISLECIDLLECIHCKISHYYLSGNLIYDLLHKEFCATLDYIVDLDEPSNIINIDDTSLDLRRCSEETYEKLEKSYKSLCESFLKLMEGDLNDECRLEKKIENI